MMNILIVGSGGREHALAWKVAQSPLVEAVFVAPGNPGTAQEEKVENLEIDSLDIPALIRFAKQKPINLTIIGPEAPLAEGMVDQFKEAGLPCFGPTSQAAILESSKEFSKAFMDRWKIPTAAYASFKNVDKAKAYLKNHPLPVVIKADGLAAGKGVVIAQTLEEAYQTVEDMLSGNAFGIAGCRIVIEEFLVGQELSFIVMTDGHFILPLSTSQDHKSRDEGDQGPNTGGMGAYSPVPSATEALQAMIMETVMRPTIEGMKAEGRPYLGFLYAGLMLTSDGPKVLEFNCRLGDPETQPLLMRLASDLVILCLAALDGNLDQCELIWDPRPALGVVLASGGYPFEYEKGHTISGLPEKSAAGGVDVKVFHAGTASADGSIVNAGGRVLCVTALGDTLKDAQAKAYEGVAKISWKDMFYRKDIGAKAL